MASRLSEWITHNLRRAEGGTHWRFEVDRACSPVAWRWERYWEDALVERSHEAYGSFAECARDARSHGFHDGHAYVLREREAVARSAWARPPQPASDEAGPHPRT